MIGALIGGLISGAGSLLSGLGAKESAEDQQRRQEMYDAQARERVKEVTGEYRENVPKWLISDAAKAGFNPVTWLQGGALGWYGTQLSGLVSSYSNATQAVNIPSMTSAIGGAISSGYGAFAQQFQFDQKMGLEQAFLGMQQSRFTPGTAGPAHPYADRLAASSGLVSYSAGSTVKQTGPALGKVPEFASGKWDSLPGPYSPGINKDPDLKVAPRKLWEWWDPNPYMPRASAIQDEYGEPAEYPYFPVKVGADIYWNAKKLAPDINDAFSSAKEFGKSFWGGSRDPVGRAIAPFFSNPGNVPAIGMGM